MALSAVDSCKVVTPYHCKHMEFSYINLLSFPLRAQISDVQLALSEKIIFQENQIVSQSQSQSQTGSSLGILYPFGGLCPELHFIFERFQTN